MTVERPHELFAQPTDAGSGGVSGEEHVNNPFAALQEQAQPEVIELVSILYDAYTVQRSLEDAANIQQSQHHEPHIPSRSIEQYGSNLNVNPSFTERYRRASLFVAAAVHIMRGSFTDYPEEPEYLRATIDAAFHPYGFVVASGKKEFSVEDSLYRERVDQQQDRYQESRKGAVIPREYLCFVIDDNSQWEPAGLWDEEPEVVFFFEQLNKVRAVQKNAIELSRENWFREFRKVDRAESIPGVHPFYRERYSQAGFILDSTAEGVMQDGKKSDCFSWLHALTCSFNEALYDLDMHIDINPTWEPSQEAQQFPLERVIWIEEVTEEP